MMRCRRQNFTSVPQALSRGSANTHWNLSATMLSCPWSIGDSFRCLTSNTSKRSFGWITIKIHNKIKHLKVLTYEVSLVKLGVGTLAMLVFFADILLDLVCLWDLCVCVAN